MDCGQPIKFDDKILPVYNLTTFGNVVNYSCAMGYVFNNSDTSITLTQMRCLANSEWSYVDQSVSYNTCLRKYARPTRLENF